MCGLTGFWGRSDFEHLYAGYDVLTHMAQAIELRGPDAFGAWADPDAGIALAHRRLAIVDLTPAGTSPRSRRRVCRLKNDPDFC